MLVRLAIVLGCAVIVSGCVVFGGAGSATLRDGEISARGVGGKAGIDARGPLARGSVYSVERSGR